MATKKPIRKEVRNAPVVPIKATRPVVPAPPKQKERRIATATPAPATPAKAVKQSAKKAEPTEKRAKNAPVAPTAPVAKKPTPGGKQKATLFRMYDALYLLDEHGPDVTELVTEVIKPHFNDLETGSIVPRLAMLNKGINKTITGTGEPSLDGEKFTFKEGDLMLIHKHNTGGVTVFNTNTAEPVSMVMDARAAKSLDYTLVPDDGDEFDQFIEDLAQRLEALGMPVRRAEIQSV